MLAARYLQRLLLASCALFALGAAAVPQAAFCAHLPDFNSRPAASTSRAPTAEVRSVARRARVAKTLAPARRAPTRPPTIIRARCSAPVLCPPVSVPVALPPARGPPRRA